MFRTSDTIMIAIMVAAAAVTYKIKHDSESQMREVRKLQTAIRYQEDTVSILKADWALMIQPRRLQALSEHFAGQLQLGPVDPHRIVDASAIPEKPLVVENDADDAITGKINAASKVKGVDKANAKTVAKKDSAQKDGAEKDSGKKLAAAEDDVETDVIETGSIRR